MESLHAGHRPDSLLFASFLEMTRSPINVCPKRRGSTLQDVALGPPSDPHSSQQFSESLTQDRRKMWHWRKINEVPILHLCASLPYPSLERRVKVTLLYCWIQPTQFPELQVPWKLFCFLFSERIQKSHRLYLPS